MCHGITCKGYERKECVYGDSEEFKEHSDRVKKNGINIEFRVRKVRLG